MQGDRILSPAYIYDGREGLHFFAFLTEEPKKITLVLFARGKECNREEMCLFYFPNGGERLTILPSQYLLSEYVSVLCRSPFFIAVCWFRVSEELMQSKDLSAKLIVDGQETSIISICQ